ncbi:twin-arginine translocation pathway signal protein [Sphingobium sp. SCG-1]|uniref:xanthine dehydrogenase family protein molybdopterin-binding subunit n=1 Tax=Sphingobium sp. SCG-1 TaxID=2072936 RepID=UPI000CD67B0C|nr:molybdopterin cofactor-binding domain-containing protein [Sphingobium sp. SCG-1]AUW57114.1 twin-arginine translocation pathway signal protein [Sphingobium sp. SCG-1]
MDRSQTIPITGMATLTRRKLIGGGALLIGFGLFGCKSVGGTAEYLEDMAIDPTNAASWVEVRPDNSIVMRTGNSDFGQGTIFTAYRQIVAEEMSTTVDAITTIVMGDTDRTPDGGGSYAFLGEGSPNIRKAAAYVYQALLDLGAKHLNVPRQKLVARDGTFTANGKSVTYGELVRGQELKLTIPVTPLWPMGLMISGTPPTKPVSEYTIIGKSVDNSVIASKVSGTTNWLSDFKLPEMLHARIIRPPSFGSKLKSVGTLDKNAFPNTRLVVKKNLVAVVSPDEWEAVQAASALAGEAKWTEWKGLPGNAGLNHALRKLNWTKVPAQKAGGKDDVSVSMKAAERTHKASYYLAYQKHVPIGPSMAVADVKPDGTAFVYAHVQNAQMLRRQIARMLNTSLDKVVVRSLPGPGHYGRSNGGSAGGEDEAVILSKELGQPVRVQWSRAEDVQWSTQSPAGFSDIEIGLDDSGKMVAYKADHYMPTMYENRPIGALLAGMPTEARPDQVKEGMGVGITNMMWDQWLYDGLGDYAQRAHGSAQVGEADSPLNIGLRCRSMRTPGHFQQNFPRELAISEAAMLAGKDPLQFRIDHATDKRVVGVLEKVREVSGWVPRPSPTPGASLAKSSQVRGRGVSTIFRQGSYWACVCEIAVTPSDGTIRVEKVTVVVDPGIVINPKQLKRQIEGGITMGLSQALREEVQFDEGIVTSQDWASYPIFTMADMPEIEVVLAGQPDVGVYGGGAEAANALPASAIAAAFADATGKVIRQVPLSPKRVREATSENETLSLGPLPA